jgi:hypothetical protein
VRGRFEAPLARADGCVDLLCDIVGSMSETHVFIGDDVPIRQGWRRLTRAKIASIRQDLTAGISAKKIAKTHGVDVS